MGLFSDALETFNSFFELGSDHLSKVEKKDKGTFVINEIECCINYSHNRKDHEYLFKLIHTDKFQQYVNDSQNDFAKDSHGIGAEGDEGYGSTRRKFLRLLKGYEKRTGVRWS